MSWHIMTQLAFCAKKTIIEKIKFKATFNFVWKIEMYQETPQAIL